MYTIACFFVELCPCFESFVIQACKGVEHARSGSMIDSFFLQQYYLHCIGTPSAHALARVQSQTGSMVPVASRDDDAMVQQVS